MYSVTKEQISVILSWIQSGTIAIPEIQRPFVWKKKQVRDLIDSLYNDYPVGYITTWMSPDARLKDSTTSMGKQILIDGQQRVTALKAAITGATVINSNYKEERIIISFNPVTEEFKVQDNATKKASEWISDISEVMYNYSSRKYISGFNDRNKIIEDGVEKNKFSDDDLDRIEDNIEKLRNIVNKEIGNIRLSEKLPIRVVNDIFNRINQKGTKLSNADFVMSNIAVYEKEDGDEFGMNLRKFLDYFCAMSVEPTKSKDIEENDSRFAETDYYNHIKWLKKEQDDLYIPEYDDILQTVLALQFDRDKIGDLAALLSGRDFEKKIDGVKEIADDSFMKLEEGINKFSDEYSFKHFKQDILITSGYSDKSILTAKNAIDYIYGIYLRLKDIDDINVETLSYARKLFVISLLRSRLSGTFLPFNEDFRRIKRPGDFVKFVQQLEAQEFSDAFWNSTLPSEFDKTNTGNQFWNVFVAAQRKLNHHGFLTKDLKVAEMITENIHHIFPKSYLIKNDVDKDKYNKIANFVFLRDDINKSLDDNAPKYYMENVMKYDGAYGVEVSNEDELLRNLDENAVPVSFLKYDVNRETGTYGEACKEILLFALIIIRGRE